MGLQHVMACAVIAALAAAVGIAASAAHGQEDDPIPAWIRTIFVYYASDEITGAELITTLEYLISRDIIQVTSAGGQGGDGDTVTPNHERSASDRDGPDEHEHAHASILVVIFGDRFDFSGPSFQMKNDWLRFESQDGTTIHRHMSGVTTDFLFATLGIWIDEDCYIFPDGREFCTNEDFVLRYYVNGEQVDSINDYVFDDQDRILITYGNEDPDEINEYLAELNRQPIVG